MRRLRPILVRVIAALLIGAVVTVGVAVGCAMSTPSWNSPRSMPLSWIEPESAAEYLVIAQRRSRGSQCITVVESPGKRGLVSWAEEWQGADPVPRRALPHTGQLVFRSVRIAGWPCACIWGAIDHDLVNGAYVNWATSDLRRTPAKIGVVSVGRPLNAKDQRGIYGQLPIAPIWSGLAVNTLFYGTIAWALMFLPGTLRRWRRRRLGRCEKCGYDRAGLAEGAACPECGGGAAR